MRPAPTRWDELWDDPESKLELQLQIYSGTGNYYFTYTNDNLASCNVEASLFDDVSIGNACSACLTAVIKDAAKDSVAFNRYTQIVFTCNLRKGNTTSNGCNQGKYYLDTVTANDDGSVKIVAYDYMFMFGRQDNYSNITGNYTVSSYLTRFSSMYRIRCYTTDFNSTTFLRNSLIGSTNGTVGGIHVYPDGIKSGREIIETAAMLAGGNAAIDKGDYLRIYRLDGGVATSTVPIGIVVTAASQSSDNLQVITGIDLDNGNTTYQSSSGWRIYAKHNESITHLTSSEALAQEINVNMHSNMSGMYPERNSLRVSNIRVSGAFITPLFELGDIASVDIGDGLYLNFQICDYNVDYVGGCWGYIGTTKTEQSIKYSIADAWNPSSGWEDGWNQGHVITDSFKVDVISNHIFRLNPDMVRISNQASGDLANIVKIASGLNPISTTFEYKSTVDGSRKSVSCSGYLTNEYYPKEGNGSIHYITNLLFYTPTNLPDDSIGAWVYGTSIKIADIDSGVSDANLVKIMLSKN